MAWQDRPYYRDRSDSTGNPLMWLMTGSVPLFTVFGIRVRMHASLLLVMVFVLLFGWGFGDTIAMRVQSMLMLFTVILLHEFGHCFAARSVGGQADDVLMTPLGGLAMAMAPRRPWAQFVTVAGGPLVNVVICLLCGIALYLAIGIFPLGPWTFSRALSEVVTSGWLQISGYLFWMYGISYWLLLFNLLPIFPLDGGQLLQSVLWKPMGYYKSMLLTVNIGLGGSVIMGMIGLATLGTLGGGLLLIFIGIMCFMNCLNMRRQLLAAGPYGLEEDEGIDYSAAYDTGAPKRKRFSKWRVKRAAKRAAADREEQRRIDAILAKVSASGMNSLTWLEKRALRKATEHQRAADLALKRRGL
ncbi:MAG TPA: site-2 protease family protein [Tepidisphaeraceae bacterium]|nr:site-2 protease family protein [Tepidisphaeraceae bacterium]